nr:TetR/AcrR family transcriptional regulator [uncultured Albidiferax sp.]
MTLAHQRQKQPELVRSQLLAVMRELLVLEGSQALTLDAVSKRAGVTKGGLQHHFRSKQALLTALCDQLFEEFEERYEQALSIEENTPGRHARAYVRTCFDSGGDCNQVETQRAIALLALSLPECRERWNAMMRRALSQDGSAPEVANLLLVCRLAADGFWFAQMLGAYDLDEARKASILLVLLRLCDEALK